MASSSRTYRSGTTTVNVNVPRSRGSSTRRRPSSSTTRTSSTRTLRQVAGTTSKRGDNTPLLVGGAALAAAGLYLLWPRSASAAEPGTVQANTFPQVQGASLGYAGPGRYRTTAPSGLNIRPAPNTGGESLALIPPGTTLDVVGDAGNGWIQVSSPVAGFMCVSCPQAPGGPWLTRVG